MAGYGSEITTAWLLGHGACLRQRAIFRDVFGDAAPLTRAAATAAARAGLDLEWLAEELLAPPDLDAFRAAIAPALGDFRRAREAAAGRYVEATADVAGAYRAAREAARAAGRSLDGETARYYDAVAGPRREAAAAVDAAWGEFLSACAAALADALGLPPGGGEEGGADGD